MLMLNSKGVCGLGGIFWLVIPRCSVDGPIVVGPDGFWVRMDKLGVEV